MTYSVKEIFYSLQGEGHRSGRAAVFCRFSGCNYWNGVEAERENAICSFCDTDFVGTDGLNGRKYESASDLANKIDSCWGEGPEKYVILTGGEPSLQIDPPLISKLKSLGFEIAIETNGSNKLIDGIDWITVSPKETSNLIQTTGDEVKLVFPSKVSPTELEGLDFKHFYLSPLFTACKSQTKEHVNQAINYCLSNPKWNFTFQYHKLVGIA